MIPLFKHNISDGEIARCVQVLKSGWHTAGPVGEEVEQLISDYYGGYKVALTNSCTAGLIAVSRAIGLKQGDEVLVPAMTFTATAASVMHFGATPVFIDIDPKTGLIDVDKIEERITPKTKAIYVVNLYGHIPDIEKISEIAKKRGLFLLEDCAHAFEAKRNGHRPATFSDAAVYSFYATKTIHCGEGGAVITKNEALLNKVKTIRRHGLSKCPKPGQPGNMGYDVIELGFKGVLSDIQASLLIGQINNADKNRAAREAIANKYHLAFKDLESVECLMPSPLVESSWYTFPLLVDHRESLAEKLKEKGIGHTVMYQSLEEFSIYDRKIKCPIALEFGNNQLSLPCYNKLTDDEHKKIINVVKEWDQCC